MEEHTTRIWFFPDLPQVRSGKSLGERPSHWPPHVEVDFGTWYPWLPLGWGQCTFEQPSGLQKGFISPEGKLYYAKSQVEKEVGEKLGEIDKDMPKEWPDWLPKDWGISHKRTPSCKKKLFVHPSLERSCFKKEEVEKLLENPSNNFINLCLGPGALPDRMIADMKKAPLATEITKVPHDQEPPLKKLCTDSEVEAIGSDEEAERGCGFLLRPFRRGDSLSVTSWLVLPDDVEFITLDLFNARTGVASWKCIRHGSKRYDFECTKYDKPLAISLYAARGRLIVQTTDKSMAFRVAEAYLDLLYLE